MTTLATSSAETTSADAVAHFAGRLQFETDPSDVHSAIHDGTHFLLVDTRGDEAWHQGRITGAIHMPRATIADRAPTEISADTPIVVYCWGPGCNGATRAALVFAQLGYSVKEMIGGFEYWAREGYPTEDDNGPVSRAADPLTALALSQHCDC
jgi:rhodanese-related sulfurtransferase